MEKDNHKKKKILIVEDEAVTLRRGAALLEKHGFDVITAVSGEEAVRLIIDGANTDLILMDIDLGTGIDGTEAAEIILKEKDIPIVFYSSHHEPEIVEKTEGITSYGYVVKNSGNVVLLASIKMAFRLFETKMNEKAKEDALRFLAESTHGEDNMIFSSMVQHLAEAVRADCAFLSLLDNDEAKRGQVIAMWHKGDFCETSSYNILKAPCRKVIADCGTVSCTALKKEYPSFPFSSKMGFDYYRGVPLQNKDGDVIGVLAVLHSVPIDNIDLFNSLFSSFALRASVELRQKKYEETIIERDIFLNRIFDILPIGLWFADKDGTLIRGNPSGVKIWGAEPKVPIEEYGVFKARLLPSGEEILPDDWALARTIREGTAVQEELLEIDAFDGKRKVILNYTEPVYDTKGRLLGAIVINNEITDRYHAEQKIRQSEEKYRLIFEHSPLGLLHFDEEGIITSCNDVFVSIIGSSKEKLVGLDMSKLKDKRLVDALNEALLGRSGYFEGEYKSVTAEKVTPVRVLFAPIMEYDGVYRGGVGIVEDITNLKKSTDEIQEKTALLQHITDNMYDLVSLADPAGHFTYVSNPHKILGYEPEWLTGKNILDFVHPDDREGIVEIFTESIENNVEQEHAEYRYLCADGSYVWLETYGKIIKDEKGNIAELLFSSRDITEKRDYEEKLKMRLKYERALAECSREFITLSDYGESVNAFLEHLLAVTGVSRVYIFENFHDRKDGLCMKQTHEVCSTGVEPEIDNPVLQHVPYSEGFFRWREILSKGEPVSGFVDDFPPAEQEILKPQDIVTLLVIPVFSEGKWFGFIGFDDVEEKKTWHSEDIYILTTAAEMLGVFIERTRRDNREKELYRQMEIILKETHHRIKNNMNTIMGLLLLQADEQEEESTANILTEAAGRVNSMMQLYNTLYRTERADNVGLREFLPPLIKEIASLFHSAVDISLELEIQDISLTADILSPLGIIINELVTNSMKHAFPERKKGRITVKSWRENEKVTVRYRDDGIGIPEKYEGSTFGMQLVEMLTDQIGGKLTVENDNGAVFIIEFKV